MVFLIKEKNEINMKIRLNNYKIKIKHIKDKSKIKIKNIKAHLIKFKNLKNNLYFKEIKNK
jgi:hypothetical protein